MRDAYYQSVGNPLQLDRLPNTRPTLELLPPSAPLVKRWGQTIRSLLLAAVVATAALVVYQPPGITWLEPFDLIFAWPTLIGGFALACYFQRWRWLVNPVCLTALVLAFVNHRTPWLAQVIMTAATLGLLVYAYGRHWSVIITTAPVPRDVADRCRAQCNEILIGIAGTIAILFAGLLWTGWPFLMLAVAVLPIIPLLIPKPAQLKSSIWLVIRTSFLSWFTFEAQPLPGLVQSPIGRAPERRALSLVCGVLVMLALSRTTFSPASAVIEFARSHDIAVTSGPTTTTAGMHPLPFKLLILTVTFISVAAVPVLIPFGVTIPATVCVLLEASARRGATRGTNMVQAIIRDLRRSTDLTERTSLYYGRVVADGSPVLVPRIVHCEHTHGLGDSGAGKTALFLAPTIEQLVMPADCSVIVLDLKADSLELLATLVAAGEKARREHRIAMPLKLFSNQPTKATFAFNPMKQTYWDQLDLQTRTDILCAANGLSYGTDYGAGFYSSANAAILHHAMKTFPNVRTFVELADCIGQVLTSAQKRELHPEIRKAGVHVHEVIKRLKACEPLNVTPTTGHPREVVEHAIDLTQVFQEPQLLYFHLNSTLSPSGAPEIARLVTYMLLAAATQCERRHPVFLVIDEFQRMVANNLEYMLQLARSMGVGIILANQSMEDLRKGNTNLIPAIEANCRLRQWFSVSSSDDQRRLMEGSGLTVDRQRGWSSSTNSKGETTTSYSETEQVVNRFTMNDVLLTSDHPFRSFLRIGRGAGYAQYGGMPVIIESEFHISAEEYQRRRAMPWPAAPGTFVPADFVRSQTESGQRTPATKPSGPVVIIDEGEPSSAPVSQAESHAIADMFEQFRKFQKADPSKPDERPS